MQLTATHSLAAPLVRASPSPTFPGQDIGFAAATGASTRRPQRCSPGRPAVASLAKLGSLAPGIARTSAEIERFNVALRNVAGSRADEALHRHLRRGRDFNAPLEGGPTANFTQLLAAAQSAGFTVAETEKVFRGLSAANAALGGDNQKLQGILLSQRQVFFRRAKSPPKNSAGKSANDCLERSANFCSRHRPQHRRTGQSPGAWRSDPPGFRHLRRKPAQRIRRRRQENRRWSISGRATPRHQALTKLQQSNRPNPRLNGRRVPELRHRSNQSSRWCLRNRLAELGTTASAARWQGLNGAQRLLNNAIAWRDSLQHSLII